MFFAFDSRSLEKYLQNLINHASVSRTFIFNIYLQNVAIVSTLHHLQKFDKTIVVIQPSDFPRELCPYLKFSLPQFKSDLFIP